MLGCHDFCGYYEWTFHYIRRRFGQAALEKYWEQAIGADSQRHYVEAARAQGLKGLYESWSKTGVDEHCDWTVALDDSCNVLRLDMRECPSKGFLLENNLNADEDYCDHCIGWIGPAVRQAGFEVASHEHNHCGQCWWEIRAVNASQTTVELAADIRDDPRWACGYLHRFEHNRPVSSGPNGEETDSYGVLEKWLSHTKRIVIAGPWAQFDHEIALEADRDAIVVSGRTFVESDLAMYRAQGVLIEHELDLLSLLGSRYLKTTNRPLLLHPYLPGMPVLNFSEYALPRPVPILPTLIRSGLYRHGSDSTSLSAYDFSILLATALGKEYVCRGFVEPGRTKA